ncbi:MAG: hypothetical protein SVS15_08340 [Thermodesulfobacteriota bacterium]|nr:hypothetical protein [Thermodesulfobacteriota bacterium]
MKKFALLFVTAAVVFLFCGPVQATSITKAFGDNTIHWADYPSNDWWENFQDVIGEPHINGGTVTFSDTGVLEEVTLNYDRAVTSWWSWTYIPGDLFIDVNADGAWDFIADSPRTQDAGLWQVYSAPSLVSYIKTPWYDYFGDVRNKHPYAAKHLEEDGELLGQAWFDGWDDPGQGGSESTYWDLSSLGIDLGQQFILAYTVTCANDVVYEQLTRPEGTSPQVPIPGAVWLLGSGLLGLLGLRKLKR